MGCNTILVGILVVTIVPVAKIVLKYLLCKNCQLEYICCRCRWDGEYCKTSQFTTELTDIGFCYTFNNDKNSVLRTAKTGNITKNILKNKCIVNTVCLLMIFLVLFFFLGSFYGLSLLINIEQCENIRGMSTDAGIKVHLPILRRFT